MARLSKAMFVILNVVVLILSIGMTAAGVSLAKQGSSGCEQWLVKPLIGLGVFLIVVSLFLGITGAWFRNSKCLLLYLVFMSVAILTLLIITFWVFAVTRKGGSRVASSDGYNLGNYSPWLKKRVTEEKNWQSLKTCLLRSPELCSKYKTKYMKDDVNQLSAEKALQPLQSGCCRPPSDCKFEYQSPTVWVKSAASKNNTNPDCNSWDSDPKDSGACPYRKIKILRRDFRSPNSVADLKQDIKGNVSGTVKQNNGMEELVPGRGPDMKDLTLETNAFNGKEHELGVSNSMGSHLLKDTETHCEESGAEVAGHVEAIVHPDKDVVALVAPSQVHLSSALIASSSNVQVHVSWPDQEHHGDEVMIEQDKTVGEVISSAGTSWFLTVVYASPNVVSHQSLWEHLVRLATVIQGPWILGRDLNATLFFNERRSNAKFQSTVDRDFLRWFETHDLVDVGFACPEFTWKRGSSEARLDRLLANES
ncbi:hypothetical protein K1719_038356 [Acacia pycnantha]|nr:hypothetical protein K1719_038356 [Acacia pycnantha]